MSHLFFNHIAGAHASLAHCAPRIQLVRSHTLEKLPCKRAPTIGSNITMHPLRPGTDNTCSCVSSSTTVSVSYGTTDTSAEETTAAYAFLFYLFFDSFLKYSLISAPLLPLRAPLLLTPTAHPVLPLVQQPRLPAPRPPPITALARHR